MTMPLRIPFYALSWTVILIFTRTEALQEHRIFPAASFERYSAEGNGILRTVHQDDFEIAYSATESTGNFLQAAKERFSKSLFVRPDYPGSFSPKNLTLVPLKRLVLSVTSNSTKLYHGMDESYSLKIENATADVALLNAMTVYGILRGLETFSQLLKFQWMKDGEHGVFSLPQTMWIADAPEYSYRGLMIDTARHYLPISLIMANLDALAMNKLNVLHLHVTDSQSFPYRSLRYPELAEKGAFHPRRVYTPEDIQLVVKEAKLRGIRVIPEFDLPAHSHAISHSHPELMSHCPEPSEPLDPTQLAVYDFLENLYSEIAHVFPDKFIHVGGDEVSFACWKNSSSIQSWMKERGMSNETFLYAYFESKLLSLVGDKHNKTTIVWQEAFNLGLPLRNDTIVDVWKKYDNHTLQQATMQGHDVLVSKCWYLDYLTEGWQDFYNCLPRNFTGTSEQKSRVIGGHASMWGEGVDATNFMSRVWPRASAAAERLWRGAMRSAEASVEERIITFRCHMVARGIAAQPIGPGCCDREPEYVHEKKRQNTQSIDGAVTGIKYEQEGLAFLDLN